MLGPWRFYFLMVQRNLLTECLPWKCHFDCTSEGHSWLSKCIHSSYGGINHIGVVNQSFDVRRQMNCWCVLMKSNHAAHFVGKSVIVAILAEESTHNWDKLTLSSVHYLIYPKVDTMDIYFLLVMGRLSIGVPTSAKKRKDLMCLLP
jgi:hypothetical protein